MKDRKLPESFMRKGGSEFAPMSTTTSLETAMRVSQPHRDTCCTKPLTSPLRTQYSRSDNAVLLRLRNTSFVERGADISYLSAFPAEKEMCGHAHARTPPLPGFTLTQLNAM